MAGADGEAVVGLEALGEVGEEGVGDLDDGGAHVAHQVLVGLVGQVEDGPTVAEVHVVDDPELLEGVEAAVDRRQVDVGVVGLDLVGELVGRDVAARSAAGR